jgi:hypothetical protein
MKIITNNEKFDSLQSCLLNEIINTVKAALEEEGASGEWLKKMTENISFRICEIIDAGHEMKCEHDFVAPFLAFYDESGESDNIIVNEVGSYLHEVVFFSTERVFGKTEKS